MSFHTADLYHLIERRREINQLPFAFRNFADLKQIAVLIAFFKGGVS